ncbi:hypothetical protein [Cellulomonas carbonis]|uniref:Uncharacterized protein n=1 Tax=Cellulomonas carbonis T26 TaxID=947969 RepID=A0A0A0BSJ6_9CELL|nr:hypothetical protein [Cellulomonas carbonis]KGM10890.1 hypothetical protein N868_08690 [Cellulomonas carbonis T26]GGC00287.1 hypothetical protein GCM10010972_11310 [Cellulomonas carbonis]
MALPALAADDDAALQHHLLLLPADVGHDEVEVLATSRFPRATWETPPTTARPRGRGQHPDPGVLRLSRHSTLVGPFTIDPGTASALGIPTSAALAYVLHAPVERGDAPWPGTGDRDGLARAFANGLPVRDEERSVGWLVAAARRLGGAVRVAATGGSPGALLVPDPAAAVDLTVWTDIWLEPDAALSVVRRAVPRAELNLPGTAWAGPPAGIGERPARGAEDLDDELRRRLHAAADDHDIATLTAPPPMNAYGCLADLGVDGMLAVEVGGETTLPPVIAAVPWASQGAVAYRVRWEPADLEEHNAERPGPEHRVARARAGELVVAVARLVHVAVGGEITDEMGFVVDPEDL